MYVSTVYEAFHQGHPLGNPINWNDGGKKVLSYLTGRLYCYMEGSRNTFQWEDPMSGERKWELSGDMVASWARNHNSRGSASNLCHRQWNIVQKPRFYLKVTQVLHFSRTVKNTEVHSLQYHPKIFFPLYGLSASYLPQCPFSFSSLEVEPGILLDPSNKIETSPRYCHMTKFWATSLSASVEGNSWKISSECVSRPCLFLPPLCWQQYRWSDWNWNSYFAPGESMLKTMEWEKRKTLSPWCSWNSHDGDELPTFGLFKMIEEEEQSSVLGKLFFFREFSVACS